MLECLTPTGTWTPGRPIRFLTQASLDIARDGDLLDRCRAAGLRTLFVGVETLRGLNG